LQPDYIAAYIGYATSSKFNYDYKDKNNKTKCYISGRKSVSELSAIIAKMISQIVLCEKCHIPELRYNVASRGVTVKCDGCGHKYVLTSISSKFSKYMINNKP
jgi:translation initiation factor 2 beta subunit (eIF-2beta)/eIF-5